MMLSEFYSKLEGLELQVDNVNPTPPTHALALIHKDLILGLQNSFNELQSSFESTFNNRIYELNETKTNLETQLKCCTDKDALKTYKADIKSLKEDITQTKQINTTFKSLSSQIQKQLRSKTKLVTNQVTKLYKDEKIKAEEAEKLMAKRHDIPFLEFHPLSDNRNHSQNKMMIHCEDFKVFNVDPLLASELTINLKARSFDSILEELSFTLGEYEEKILVIWKGTLKFIFNVELVESIKSIRSGYNKTLKGWYIPFDKFETHEAENCRDIIQSSFNVVVDLDNTLIYTKDNIRFSKILNKRRSMPKFHLLAIPLEIDRDFMDGIKDTSETLQQIFESDKGLAIYNPVTLKFEAIRKTSTIITKIPSLMFRKTKEQITQIYILDIKSLEISNFEHTNNLKRSQFIYRSKLIDITEDDFSHIQ